MRKLTKLSIKNCATLIITVLFAFGNTYGQNFNYQDSDPALEREAKEKKLYFEKLIKEAQANLASCNKGCNVPIGHTHDPNDSDGPCKPTPNQTCKCHCNCTQSYEDALIRIRQQEDNWRLDYGKRLENWKLENSKSKSTRNNTVNSTNESVQKYLNQLEQRNYKQQERISTLSKTVESITGILEVEFRKKMQREHIKSMNERRLLASNDLKADLKANGGQLIECYFCDGKGIEECIVCEGADNSCKECTGVGYDNCGECYGVGLLYKNNNPKNIKESSISNLNEKQNLSEKKELNFEMPTQAFTTEQLTKMKYKDFVVSAYSDIYNQADKEKVTNGLFRAGFCFLTGFKGCGPKNLEEGKKMYLYLEQEAINESKVGAKTGCKITWDLVFYYYFLFEDNGLEVMNRLKALDSSGEFCGYSKHACWLLSIIYEFGLYGLKDISLSKEYKQKYQLSELQFDFEQFEYNKLVDIKLKKLGLKK